MSKCIVCNKEFEEGDEVQAFLRCPEDTDGSWTESIIVDSTFNARVAMNSDRIKRKHFDCETTDMFYFSHYQDHERTELIYSNADVIVIVSGATSNKEFSYWYNYKEFFNEFVCDNDINIEVM